MTVEPTGEFRELRCGTGGGLGTFEVSGRVYSNATSTGNVGTAETTLGSYSILANSMPADSGKAIRVIAWGKTAANANNKTIYIKFGATTVSTLAVAGTNDKDWLLEATIIQGATGAQTAIGRLYLEGAGNQVTLVSTPAETETGAILVKCSAISATAGDDILMKGMIVEFIN